MNARPAAWPHLAGSMPRLAPSQLRSTKGHRKHTQQAGGTSEVRQREGLPGGNAGDKETGYPPSCCQGVFRGRRSELECWGAGTCPPTPDKPDLRAPQRGQPLCTCGPSHFSCPPGSYPALGDIRHPHPPPGPEHGRTQAGDFLHLFIWRRRHIKHCAHNDRLW